MVCGSKLFPKSSTSLQSLLSPKSLPSLVAMFSLPPPFLGIGAASSSGDRDDREALAAAAGAASSTGDGAAKETASSAMEGVVECDDEENLFEDVSGPSGLKPAVQKDLLIVEDHFRGLRELMLRLVGQYGSGPGDDAISDHLRRAHEDLQAKLVMAGTRPPIELLPARAFPGGDVPAFLDVPDAVSDVPDASGDASAVPRAPDVSDDIISLSSENTQFYPDDHAEDMPLVP